MILEVLGSAHADGVIDRFVGDLRSYFSGWNYQLFQIQRDQYGFIIMGKSGDDTAAIAYEVNRIAQTLSGRENLPAHLITSIGGVDFPSHATSPEEAIDKALIALHNRNSMHFAAYARNESSVFKSMQHMKFAQYISKAIQGKRVRMAFQPIVSCKTGHVEHFEALLRLIGEDGRPGSAGMLIPVAERMGMIFMIDELTLDMVIHELELAPNLTLAFNVSSLTTSDHLWLDKLSHLLKNRPEVASRMIIEITETAANRDLRDTALFTAKAQNLGCRVALDDFGAGYTSFRQLKALSVDMVKIDGTFIRDLADNSDNRYFVRTLLDYTNSYGLDTIAECVENGEAAKLLMEMGVTHLQGFYFGKPIMHRSWLEGGEYGTKRQ